jgi:hypothetical protein
MAVTVQRRAEGLGQLVARSLQLGLVLLCVLGGLSSLPSTDYFVFSIFQPVSQPAPVVCLLPVCMPILGNASGCMEGFPQPALSWSRAGWDPGQLRRRGGQYPDWAPPPSFADGPPWPHNVNFSFTPKFPGGVGSAELAKFLASSRSPPATPLAGESLAVFPAARQQPLTGELLLKFLVDSRPTLATEPMVVQSAAQPAPLSPQQPAQFSAYANSNLSVCLATGTIAVVAPVPVISWLGRIRHHISAQSSAFRAAQQHARPSSSGPSQQWQEFSPAAGTQWFSNQAAASAQLLPAAVLRTHFLAVQRSTVFAPCSQPTALYTTLPASSPCSPAPLWPMHVTAQESASRQLPKQPADCAAVTIHPAPAGECDQWYNGTLVFTSGQPAVTPWLPGGWLPSAHPDQVERIAQIPSAAPMGAGASASPHTTASPASIPLSVGSTRGPSHPYRVGRGRRPGGPSSVGPGIIALPITPTLSVEAVPFLFPELGWFSFPVSQVASYRFACLRALVAAVGRGLAINVALLLAVHCNWFMAGCTLIMCGLATLMFVSWDLARPKDDPESCDDYGHDEDWEGPVFNLLHSCELMPHSVGRWVRGTKLVAEIHPLPKLPPWWYRRAKKVAEADKALAAERSDAYYINNLIIIGIATVVCLCGVCLVTLTRMHQPSIAARCPVMIIAFFLGKVATILRGCGYSIIYHVGVPCMHAFTLGVMAAPAVTVSCVRFLATTPVAVWQAAQPSLDVCHEHGVFALAPGAHAFMCSWVQPKVWAFLGHFVAPLKWRGAVYALHFMEHLFMGCSVPLGGGVQFAFPLLPSLGVSGALWGAGALGGFEGLRPGTTLAPVWGGIVVGLSAGFAIVLRWTWERRPRARDIGRVGLPFVSRSIHRIIRCVVHVVYWLLCTVIMHCTCLSWPMSCTHPVLAFLHASMYIALLVLVTMAFSLTGQPVRYSEFVNMLRVVCSSPRAQIQFASLLSVVLTAELAVLSDDNYNTVVSVLTNDKFHVIIFIITIINIILYYLPYYMTTLVSKTTCLPCQPEHNRCSKLLRRLTTTDRPGLAPAVTQLNSENTVTMNTNVNCNTTDEITSDNNSTRAPGGQSSPPACSGISNPPACCCHHDSSEHKHKTICSFASKEVERDNQTGKLGSRSTLSATVGLPVAMAPHSSAMIADLDPIYYVDEDLPVWEGLVEATRTCVPAETQLSAELPQQATQPDVTSDEYVAPGEPVETGDQDDSGGTPALSEAHHRDPNHVGIIPAYRVRSAKVTSIVWYAAVSFLTALVICQTPGFVRTACFFLSHDSLERQSLFVCAAGSFLCTMLLSRTARARASSLIVQCCKYVFHLVALTIMLVMDVMALGYAYGRTFVTNYFARAATVTEDGQKIARVITITDSAQLIDEIKFLWLLWLAVATFNYFKVPLTEEVTPVCAGETALFSNSGLPSITATSGIALMEQIDAWLDSLLVCHFRINQTERQYVIAFKATVGRSHPIDTMLDSPDPDEQFIGTFFDEMLRRADAATDSFRAHTQTDIAEEHLLNAVAGIYPAYDTPEELVRAIATAELAATRPNARVEAVREAEQDLKLLERQLAREINIHETRTGLERYEYIHEHKDLCKKIKLIDKKVAHYETTETNAKRRYGGDRILESKTQQYNNVNDFVALNWARKKIMLRLGAINHLNVKLFEQLRMLPGETPLQAHARVRREAEVIDNAQVGSFQMDIALFCLITVAERPDKSTFLTKTLWEMCYHTVNTQQIILKIAPNDHARIVELWIRTADRAFAENTGRDHAKAKAMDAELAAHGKWHEEFKKLRAGGSTTPSKPSTGAAQGKKWCMIHQNCGHTTDECNEVAQRIKGEKKGTKPKAQEVLVTTPQAGADQVAMGTNPNSIFAKAQNPKATPQGGTPKPPKVYAKCPTCSAVAGSDQKHGVGSCFLDGVTAIPDFWKPRNKRILDAANKLRRQRGQSPLTLYVPPEAAAAVEPEAQVSSVIPHKSKTQRKTANVVSWEDNIVATVGGVDVIPFVGMISEDDNPEPTLAGYATRDPTLAIRQHVSFNKEARKFTCLATEQTCTVTRAKTYGMLLQVTCNLCKQTFKYQEIPLDWRAVSLWATDPKVLPEESRAKYTPPPAMVLNPEGGGSADSAFATGTTNYNDVDQTPTIAEVQVHLKGNGVIPNKPHLTLPINRLACAYVLDEVSQKGYSRWEYRFENLLFGREPEHIAEKLRQLEDYRTLRGMVPVTPDTPLPTPVSVREPTSAPTAPLDKVTLEEPSSGKASRVGVWFAPDDEEEVVVQPADHISVPPVELNKGKGRAHSASTSAEVDINLLIEQFEALKASAAASFEIPSPKSEDDQEMAELREVVAKLSKRLDQQTRS